jgi:hypothetical protein
VDILQVGAVKQNVMVMLQVRIVMILILRILVPRLVVMDEAVEVVYLLMTGNLVVHVDELLKQTHIPKYGIVQVVVLVSRQYVLVHTVHVWLVK